VVILLFVILSVTFSVHLAYSIRKRIQNVREQNKKKAEHLTNQDKLHARANAVTAAYS
jgi:hypothetical protein